jgi:hypothetical protein
MLVFIVARHREGLGELGKCGPLIMIWLLYTVMTACCASEPSAAQLICERSCFQITAEAICGCYPFCMASNFSNLLDAEQDQQGTLAVL